MTPEELVEGFHNGALATESFGHREHVQLTWILLVRDGRARAEEQLLAGLRAFAARAGKPDKFDAALTRAWIAAIDEAREKTAAITFEELIAARPDLLHRSAVGRPGGAAIISTRPTAPGRRHLASKGSPRCRAPTPSPSS